MITDSLQGNAMLSGAPLPTTADVATRQTTPNSATKAPRAEAQEASQQQENNLDLKSVQDAARKIEKFVNNTGSELSFSVDQDTGINVVKVVDTGTKEIIRQIPSREIIQLAQALDRVQGLLVKDKA